MSPYGWTLYVTCLVAKLCTCQTTSSVCSSCSTAPTCRGCELNADYTTTSNTSWFYDPNNPAVGTPIPQVYLQFTAYSATLTSSVNSTCVKHTSPSVPLMDPFINLAWEATVFDSQIIYHADFSYTLHDSYSSLNTRLGYESCTPGLPPSPAVPNWYLPSPTASFLTTLAESSASPRHVHTTQVIIVSVIVPTAALIALLLSFIAIRRHRMKQSQEVLMSQPNTTSDTQLYLDRKAELEDQERRKHELDAAGITYEMEGEDRIFEMPSGRDTETRLVSFRETHEMGGVEHSQELAVPGNTF